MITYKENEKYIFVYKGKTICVAVLRKEDGIIEFCSCVLTVDEFKEVTELFL